MTERLAWFLGTVVFTAIVVFLMLIISDLLRP